VGHDPDLEEVDRRLARRIVLAVRDPGAGRHPLDPTGAGAVMRPGDVQRVSAGPGVTHREYNASREAPVHFLQIWIMPDRRGLPPGYEQKTFSQADQAGRLRLVASPDGAEDSVTIHASARLYAGVFGAGQ